MSRFYENQLETQPSNGFRALIRSAAMIFSVLALMIMVSSYAQAQCPKPTLAGSTIVCVNDATQYYLTNFGIPGGVPADANLNWQVNTVYGQVLTTGFDPLGRPFVSVKWHTSSGGNPLAWVKASYTSSGCPGVNGDNYPVSVYDLPITYNFSFLGPYTPEGNSTNAYYCHGGNGVSLTLSGSQISSPVNFRYEIVRSSDDVVIAWLDGTGSALTFTDVKVEDDALPGASSTEYYVLAYNPQLCEREMTGKVTVHKYAEPTVLFEVNSVEAQTGTHFEYCYDEEITVTLSDIVLGSASMVLSWEVEGDASLNGTDVVVEEGDILFGPEILDAGTYTVTLTKLEDGFTGCSHTDLSIYYFVITIHPEPEIEVELDGVLAHGGLFERCYNDVIQIDMAGVTGNAPWTAEWSVVGPSGFSASDVMTGVTGTWTYDLLYFPVGLYTLTITSLADDFGCEATQATLDSYQFNILVNPEPAVGFSFDGDLAETGDTFEYCYDEPITVTLSDIWAGTAPFSIEWQVDNGIAPVTYTFNGGLGDKLWDNLTYAVGTYTITVNSIVDADGCSPDDYSPWLAYLTINPEPAVGFSFNGNLAATGSEFEYCYDETVTVTLSHIWSGTAPFDISWTVNGVPATATNVFITDELFSNVLTPDTYVVQITSIVDAEGCSPSTYVPYTATAIVHPEPELEVKVDGDIAHGADLDFCFDDVIEITMAGTVGTAPWTVDWEVNGPSGFYAADQMSGVSDTWTYDLKDFLPGTYTLTITSLVDDKGCVATQATLDSYEFNIIIHQEPKVTAITLVYSLNDDLSAYSAVSGNLDDGYEICINDNDDYYYLGVSSLTADDVLKKDYANEFFFGTTPPGFFAYWAARGVDGSNNAGGWELAMWDIINGDEPVFTLEYDGTDYSLYDGLQGKPDFLRINGDYLPGEYTFTGTVQSADGCFSDVTVAIEFLDDPNADAGDDPLCVTESFYELEAEYSVVGSTGEWSYVGPGTLSFIPDINTATATITADVAGVYTLTWTETNGICVDSDDVVVTFLKGTIADAYNFNAMSDVEAVSNAPVVVLMQYNLPVADVNADANIIMDGIIRLKNGGTWPAGAKVLEVERRQAITSTWFPVNPTAGDLGGKDHVFLSDLVLPLPNPLFNNINPTYPWVITVGGIASGTYEYEVELVTYISKPADLDVDCYAILDSEEFSVNYEEAVITVPAECVTTCYEDDLSHSLDFAISIQYPTITNVDVDDEITLDALLTITDGNALNAVQVYWGYNAPATNPSSFIFTGETDVLLSEIVGGSPTPMSGHSGLNDVWNIKVVGLNPGYYDLKVEALALVENYIGTQIKNNTGVGLPQAQPGDFDIFDYTYAEEEFCFNVVGALGVTVDAGDDIETVTGAPVIFEVEVAYGDLASQNIDPSVLVDALIEFDAPTPAGAYIVELLYNGFPVTLANDDIGSITSTLLSSLIGSPANALAPHTGLTDVWTITIAGVDVEGTVTATIKSIAYVDYNVCHSVMAEDEIVVTWADLVTSATTPDIICEGEVAEFEVTITYPTITANNPSAIKTDATLQIDQIIDAGVELEWSYNGSPYSKYTFPSDLPALQLIKLSHIINSSVPAPALTAPTPLAGHDGITVTWDLKITGLDRVGGVTPVYELFIVPIATLDGEDYDLEQVTPLTEIPITVFKAIDPSIGGVTSTFSGAVEEYSVAEPMDYLPTYPTYSWSADPALAVSIYDPSARVVSLTFIWDDPLPYNEVDLTVVINDGVCVASETITIEILQNRIIGQLKYYNSQNSPMPSPYSAQTPVGEITDYFYVSLVDNEFDVESDPPYFGQGGKAPSSVIETQKVETYYEGMEEPPTKSGDFFLEAAFGFDYNLDPNEEYRIVVWDGGFFEEGDLGNIPGAPELLYSWTWNNWNSEGKINAGDALMIMHMAVNNQVNAFPNMCHIGANNATPVKYGFYAQDVANVNASGGPNPITSLDALLTMRRSLGLIPNWPTSPQYRKPNFAVMGIMDELDVNDLMDGDFSAFDVNYWCTTLPEIAFTKRGELYKASTLAEDHNYYTDRTEFGTGWKYFNIFYNNVGDVRSRTVPDVNLWKAAPGMELNYTDVIVAGKGTEVTIPVSLDQFADLGAMSLGLTYRKDLIEVIATSYGQDNAMINHNEGSVRLGWASMEGQQFEADAPVVLLTVRVLADIDASVRLFELTGYTELVDRNLNTVEGVNFKSFSLTTDAAQATGTFAATNYPNPFNAQTTISYTLPEAGNVSLIIYNKMGQVVKTMVKDYQNAGLHQVMVNSTDLNGPGVYYYKLEVKGGSNDYSSSNSMILIR